MREVKLPSGAVLRVNPAPFAHANALYKAILKEAKAVELRGGREIADLVKNAFCAGFSSPDVEAALWKCMERCQYCDQRGELRIDGETFEPVGAREDYTTVCVEVARENVDPFVKSLSSDFKRAMAAITAFRR